MPGLATLDLLRVTAIAGLREQAPYGTGNFAVVTDVSRSAACANGVCTFVDTQAALQTYSVAVPTYFPLLDFWPGNLVLSSNEDTNSVLDGARAWMDSARSGRGGGARIDRARADLHELRFACGLDAAVVELLFGDGTVGVLRAGSISAGGKTQHGRRTSGPTSRAA